MSIHSPLASGVQSPHSLPNPIVAQNDVTQSLDTYNPSSPADTKEPVRMHVLPPSPVALSRASSEPGKPSGEVCAQGPRTSNQDRCVIKHWHHGYLGAIRCSLVCDGHCKKGHDVAQLIADQLPSIVKQRLTSVTTQNDFDILRVVYSSFKDVQSAIKQQNFEGSGSTAVLTLEIGEKI